MRKPLGTIFKVKYKNGTTGIINIYIDGEDYYINNHLVPEGLSPKAELVIMKDEWGIEKISEETSTIMEKLKKQNL